MDFKLKINLDNDAFQYGTEYQVNEILKDVMIKINAGIVGSRIFDVNGNYVGEWSFD